MKKIRIDVQRDTINFVSKNNSKFKSKIIKYENFEPDINIKRLDSKNFETIIEVLSIDTLDAVIYLKNKYIKSKYNVGFLVMANSTNPGGRYKDGTPGQEESICRRTNLVSCLKLAKYPIPEFGSIYIKNLRIIRDTEKNNYTYFKQSYSCDCLLSAAYHSPPIDSNNKICDGFRKKTSQKIKSILNAFIMNNNKHVVLGAYGCGAFGNPVDEISNIFYEILNKKKYKTSFEHIVFAILKDVGIKNYHTFCEKFSKTI